MTPNYYLGDVSSLPSNMQSMFGSSPTQGTAVNPSSPIAKAYSVPQQPVGVSGPPSNFSPLMAQAVRPTNTAGYDPSYAQNLATYVGNLFQRPSSGQPLQFNPFGNLSDINVPTQNVGGLPGLPQTLLQWAQMFNPSALTPAAPVAQYGANGNLLGYYTPSMASGNPNPPTGTTSSTQTPT